MNGQDFKERTVAVTQEPTKTENISLTLKFEGDSVGEFARIIAAKVIEGIAPLLTVPEKEDELMNTEEVAGMIGKSKGQIYQWVNNAQHGLGTFPYMKAGKSLRFSKNAVLEWMKRA
jgi:excisionase family DNA binding protein